MELMVKDEHLM